MKILSSLLPILIMLVIGVICKKKLLLSRTGIRDIKNLITSIVLPVAVFHALATADYNVNTLLLFACMMLVLLFSFGIGFVLRPILPAKYSRYLPFIVSVYEGGMMAFPLYMNLFGEDRLSNIAVFDIATMLFCFSIFIAMLQSEDSGRKRGPFEIVQNAFRNPVFIAAVLGILSGVTGIVKMIINTEIGMLYLSMKNSITTILNSLILIAVGYDFEFDRSRVKLACRAIAVRVVIQGLLLIPVIALIRYLYSGNMFMISAAMIYMFAPPSFGMQSYLNSDNDFRENFTREEEMQMELDNPLCFHFEPQILLNGKMLSASHGCSVSYNPCLPDRCGQELEAKWAVEHYGLDHDYGWVICRNAFPWAGRRRPAIKTLSVTMEQQSVQIPGPHFKFRKPGESFLFYNPVSKMSHSLTVEEMEKETLPVNRFGSEHWIYPTNCTVMRYTISPEPENKITIYDCDEGDQPLQKNTEENAFHPVSKQAICIIGGADGPAEIVLGMDSRRKLRTAYSSLHFEPVREAVEWRRVFHIRQFEKEEFSLTGTENGDISSEADIQSE